MASPTTTRKRPAPKSAPAPAPEAEAPDQTTDNGDAEASENNESPAQTTSVARTVPTSARALNIPGVRAHFTPTALILPEKISIVDWSKVVDAIDGVREGSRWWLGDAINAGEARFGEKYSQALDASRYDYASLRNLAMVARRFQPDTIGADGEIIPGRRHAGLSWSHHHAVIGVPNDVADEILAKSEADSWSVSQVREHVKEIKSSGATAGGTAPSRNGTGGAVPGAVTPTDPSKLPGVKPLAEAEIQEYAQAGKTVYECDGCNLTFGVQVWHCLGCGGHWTLDVDDCQNEMCGVDDGDATGGTAPAVTGGTTSGAVSGTVIPGAATGGSDQAILVLSSFRYADLDPTDAAASFAALAADGVDVVATLLETHQWLSQVIEALAAGDDEMDDAARQAEIEAEESEGDGLGDLDFEASEDDESGDESAEASEDAAEAPEAVSRVATGRSGAWSTEGANVKPAASAAVSQGTLAQSRPMTPAPKPGAGKPVRRRAGK